MRVRRDNVVIYPGEIPKEILSRRRSEIRKKLRTNVPCSQDELNLFLPGVVDHLRKEGMMKYGIPKPSEGLKGVTRFKQSLEPLINTYRDKITENPDLSNRDTQAALHLLMIDNATTPTEIQRALAQLQKMFGLEVQKIEVIEEDAGNLDEAATALLERLEGRRKKEKASKKALKLVQHDQDETFEPDEDPTGHEDEELLG